MYTPYFDSKSFAYVCYYTSNIYVTIHELVKRISFVFLSYKRKMWQTCGASVGNLTEDQSYRKKWLLF